MVGVGETGPLTRCVFYRIGEGKRGDYKQTSHSCIVLEASDVMLWLKQQRALG